MTALPWSWWPRRKIVCRPVTAPAAGPLSRTSFPIWVDAPGYDPLSGGTRAINLLGYHLQRLGYDAFVINTPRRKKAAPLPLRYLTPAVARLQWQQGREPIVVYPEIVVGNPRRARFVVRFLLNRPGFFVPGAELSYGRDDYFIDHAREHVPSGARSFDLFMPLVDRAIYRPPPPGIERSGFGVFANRAVLDAASFPQWLAPYVVLSMDKPRSHAALAEIYRGIRALVVFERTAAIFEALLCGCPVICIGNDNFDEATYHPRFRDCGLVWGWRDQDIAAAAARTSRFRLLYDELEASLDQRIQEAFDWILADAWRRRHGPGRSE